MVIDYLQSGYGFLQNSELIYLRISTLSRSLQGLISSIQEEICSVMAYCNRFYVRASGESASHARWMWYITRFWKDLWSDTNSL